MGDKYSQYCISGQRRIPGRQNWGKMNKGDNLEPVPRKGTDNFIIIDDDDSSIEIIESPGGFSEPSIAYGSPETHTGGTSLIIYDPGTRSSVEDLDPCPLLCEFISLDFDVIEFNNFISDTARVEEEGIDVTPEAIFQAYAQSPILRHHEMFRVTEGGRKLPAVDDMKSIALSVYLEHLDSERFSPEVLSVTFSSPPRKHTFIERSNLHGVYPKVSDDDLPSTPDSITLPESPTGELKKGRMREVLQTLVVKEFIKKYSKVEFNVPFLEKYFKQFKVGNCLNEKLLNDMKEYHNFVACTLGFITLKNPKKFVTVASATHLCSAVVMIFLVKDDLSHMSAPMLEKYYHGVGPKTAFVMDKFLKGNGPLMMQVPLGHYRVHMVKKGNKYDGLTPKTPMIFGLTFHEFE